MTLLKHRDRVSDEKVAKARLQIDLALLKMTELLDQVQEQADRAKEELSERRSD